MRFINLIQNLGKLAKMMRFIIYLIPKEQIVCFEFWLGFYGLSSLPNFFIFLELVYPFEIYLDM